MSGNGNERNSNERNSDERNSDGRNSDDARIALMSLSISLKWGILLKILPLTLLFCLAKWGVHKLSWEPWAFDSLTASLFGAATFVIALVLGGTLSDYRTSEDMPAQIVNVIDTIQDSSTVAAARHADYSPVALREGLARVLQAILDWLQQGKSIDPIAAAITDLNVFIAQLEPFVGAPTIARIQAEQAKLRLLVTRMQIIRDTDFLAPAYILLNLFLIGAIAALLLIGAERFSENLVVSAFLFTSFTYLVALIRDLDNPFQYDGKSSVDVDLSPLYTALQRLRSNQ